MEVERRQRGRPEQRRGRDDGRGPQPRAPAARIARGPEATRPDDDRKDRDERELEGYLERRARPREGEDRGRDRQAAQHVDGSPAESGQDRDDDHDRRAERRDAEAGERRVQDDGTQARDRRRPLDVDREHEPLAPRQQPPEQREGGGRHQADVEAGDGEDVDHTGAAERIA